MPSPGNSAMRAFIRHAPVPRLTGDRHRARLSGAQRLRQILDLDRHHVDDARCPLELALHQERRRAATTYFSRKSGVGLAILFLIDHPAQTQNAALNIGVVGLGAGTLARKNGARALAIGHSVDSARGRGSRQLW